MGTKIRMNNNNNNYESLVFTTLLCETLLFFSLFLVLKDYTFILEDDCVPSDV